MSLSGYRSIFKAEPIQWAADYLQDLLETLEESTLDSTYCLNLLALEREELRELWRTLIEKYKWIGDEPVFYTRGQEAARLFAVRQLLAVLPSLSHCPLHNEDIVFSATCKRLVDEYFFLSGFRLALEEKSPPDGIVARALEIMMQNKLIDKLFFAGHRLHLYCIEYTMPNPAYYIAPSHTIVCGTSKLDYNRQLHCLLHEFGHVLYTAHPTGKNINVNVDVRKKAAERFADRFADGLLTLVR